MICTILELHISEIWTLLGHSHLWKTDHSKL